MSNLSERFDGLQTREKVLITLMALAIAYMAVEFALLKPADDRGKRLSGQLQTAQSALESKQSELSQLQTSAGNSADRAHLAQIQAMEQQLTELQSELATIAGGLMDARHLPRTLEDVLVKTGKLSLQKLQALPVEELQLTATDERGEPLSAGIYKHAVSLQLEGRFFDVVNYLKALEALPWGLRWEKLHYRSNAYPTASVTLQVYTLTAEEGLFGEP